MSPSEYPLIVAVHLPPVEFREMIGESDATEWLRQGKVSAATRVHKEIVQRIRETPEIAGPLAVTSELEVAELTYLQIAQAISAFIRSEIRLRETRFHRFVFEDEPLTDQELARGLLFYGRGQCAACHTGTYFSDFEFHAIPFGVNGGVKLGHGAA